MDLFVKKLWFYMSLNFAELPYDFFLASMTILSMLNPARKQDEFSFFESTQVALLH